MAFDINGTAQGDVAPAPAPETVTPAPVAQVDTDRERTKEQFDKLLDSNRRLYEANENLRKEMETRRTANETFKPINQVPSNGKPEINVNDFVEVDPKTGDKFINDTKLKAKLEEVNEKASRAEQVVQSYIKTSEDREIERQNKEAFEAYPDLVPGGEKFDNVFHRQVRGVLYDSMLNTNDYGGRPLSFKEAADFVRGKTGAPAPTVPETAPDNSGQVAKDQSSAQANSEANVSRQALSDDAELRQLQMRTRMGDNEALAKRLLGTEHILPKDAQLT